MMMFSNDKVLYLHQLLIEETGGSPDVRDIGLLDSALKGAYATFDGQELYPTKLEKAARLGFSLISNHAFVDGNKRIGMYIMLMFLELNGVKVTAKDQDVIDAGLSVADGRIGYEELLAWVRKFSDFY